MITATKQAPKIIEINQDLTDMNFFLIAKKAMGLWDFQKQQSEMCNNCGREDWDFKQPEKRYDPSNPIWKEIEEHNKQKCKATARGFFLDDIWMELDDGENLDDALNEMRIAYYHQRVEDIEERENDDAWDQFWVEFRSWKRKSGIFEEQPPYPGKRDFFYSAEQCKEKLREHFNTCKLNQYCNQDECSKKCSKYVELD